MFEKLPDLVDPVHCADHNMRFQAHVNQSDMPRLKEQVAATKGCVEVDIRFSVHPVLKSPAFELKVVTELNLQCQTSLESFEFLVESQVKGVYVTSMALAEDLEEDIEVYELPEDKVAIIDLVEDEVLLAIPIAPRKPGAGVQWQDEPWQEPELLEQESTPNPFAALKTLKH